MFWVVLAVAFGEWFTVWLMKMATWEKDKAFLAGGCYSFLIGGLMQHISAIETDYGCDVDFYHYGELTSQGEWFFFLQYFGTALLLVGIVQMLFCFYQLLKTNKAVVGKAEEAKEKAEREHRQEKDKESKEKAEKERQREKAERFARAATKNSERGWACPFCDYVNPEDAPNCENCGVDAETAKSVGK